MITELLLATVLANVGAQPPEAAGACSVSIVVVDGADKKPLPGAEVYLRARPHPGAAFSTGRDQVSLATGYTDTTGIARWESLAHGPDYYVVARFPGYSSSFGPVPCASSSSEPTEIVLRRPISVSMVQLIAHPETWHGKQVRVIGFLNLEFEDNALFMHEEDWKRAIHKNALWVDKTGGKCAGAQRRYVIMVGTFDATSHGHMGMNSGTLTDITRCDVWRAR